jgi:predicted CXXCH cytochrome family protein
MKAPEAAFGLTVGALAAIAAFGAAARAPAPAPPGAPTANHLGGSVTSRACRSCHAEEYASWHASFHRTMTRLATPESVAGPFEGTRVESEGRTIELSRRGDELYVKLPDPDAVAALTRKGAPAPSRDAPLVTRRVVLATGSHHHEVYWVAGAENELRLVPITYLVAERRFIPRRDAFLQPPDAVPHAVRWNSNCIQCHSTLGRPGHDEAAEKFASGAAELGIACEACHGPGAAHAEKYRNPLTRLQAYFSKAPDETIVNPDKLAHERASEVCGQCHAYFVPRSEDAWWKDGFASSYRPGEPLERSRLLLGPADFRSESEPSGRASAEAEAGSAFWSDGTMRVGGRELNALRASACYTRGVGKKRISCLSCHSMHESDPDDQLRAGDDANSACHRCHEGIAKRATEHSRHRALSSGNSCVACHMPYTSYALFKGIRSHRIDSPSRTSESDRPNACNLCHLDRSLAWTRATLTAWYGTARPDDATATTPSPPPTTPEIPAAVELLLAGDAAERAVAAWAFGLAETREASRGAPPDSNGANWQVPYLAALLDDPYSAVRYVAARSLRTFPGFSRVEYDFLAPKERRRAVRDGILARFEPERPRIDALLARQDDRPVSISE